MNVIVANKNIELMGNLDIDIIKNINGIYSAEEIIQAFSNFFFNKMFLDITSIKEYENIDTMKKLVLSLNMNKVVLVINGMEVSNTKDYIKELIELGIYNLAFSKEDLTKLSFKTNTIDDANLLLNSIKSDITDNNQNTDALEKKDYGIKLSPLKKNKERLVIGVKNLTSGAGATTFCYMLKKELEVYKRVIALEINKSDFKYFKENDMYSIKDEYLFTSMNKYIDVDILLVDLNDSTNTKLCDRIIYLIEPSIIKLNKVLMDEGNIFTHLKNEILILNKSLLDKKGVDTFKSELGIKILANIPPIDDRLNRYELIASLIDDLNII